MVSTKKIAALAALVVVALLFMMWLAGLLHFGKIAPGTVALKAAPPGGRVVVVQEGEIPRELIILGGVISPSLAQVSSQVPGRVSRIWVEVGSRVKARDPLVTLTAPEYQARVRQAEAAAVQAQAHLNQVSGDYQRYGRLLKEEAVSPQEFQVMEARYKAARAALTQARAMVSEAATLKGYTVIRAPQVGVVAARPVAVGDLAQPGQPLVSLYNPEMLQIEGEVNDSFRQAVRVGTAVQITVPAVTWQATLPIAEIFPISESGSRTFKVRTRMMENPDLVPGMFARLTLPLGKARGLLIPKAAVRQVGQLSMVQVVVDNQATRRQVKLGRQVGDKVEVLAGLQAGERLTIP